MAYNPYYPTYYPQANLYGQQQMPLQGSQMPQNAPAQSNNGIIWVQGESAAKSYPVAAGQSVLLMDSEGSVMYIKSVDASGMPHPLRIYDYKERKGDVPEGSQMPPVSSEEYVPRNEYEEFKEDIRRALKGIRRPAKKTEEEEG